MKNLYEKRINANYIKGINTYTGNIVFYEKYFEYIANLANANTKLFEIKYEDIAIAKPTKTLGLVNNGISVELNNSNVIKFVVFNNKNICDYINNKINKDR